MVFATGCSNPVAKAETPQAVAPAAAPVQVATAAADAGEQPPLFTEGTPYVTVRAALMASDYLPAPVEAKARAGVACGARAGEADLCQTWPEVRDCSGAGFSPCTFVFERRSDGKRLTVVAYGEAPSAFKYSQARWEI